MALRARHHGLQFDRAQVFERLIGRLPGFADRELSAV